jgi:tagatose-6-phosphate ketose/aldose isomerase
MKNALTELLDLSEMKREKLGIRYTASEIAGQVDIWEISAAKLFENADQLRLLLHSLRDARGGCVVCTGAGTSEFIGYCIEGLLRKRLGLPVNVFSTTRIVTTPWEIFFGGAKPLLLSFARSGNSPESVGAVQIAEMMGTDLNHLVVTCNREGELYHWALQRSNVVAICLHERTDDRGLAMTSSFTNMLIAGQAFSFVDSPDEYTTHLDKLITAGKEILREAPDRVKGVCDLDFNRAVFLGNGTSWGTAVESHLKLQELTSGRVMCAYDTFLGLRHGPEALINDRTLVVAYLSRNPYLRRYEEELLKELRKKRIGRVVLVCGSAIDESILSLSDCAIDYDPDGDLDIPDDLLPPVQVILGQLLGLFKSLTLGFKPDSPSEGGVINRVVEGVRVYDPESYRHEGKFRIIAER